MPDPIQALVLTGAISASGRVQFRVQPKRGSEEEISVAFGTRAEEFRLESGIEHVNRQLAKRGVPWLETRPPVWLIDADKFRNAFEAYVQKVELTWFVGRRFIEPRFIPGSAEPRRDGTRIIHGSVAAVINKATWAAATPLTWQERWAIADSQIRTGGQGTVRKVTKLEDGSLGALKEIRAEDIVSRNRRYRFYQEVRALQQLNGAGVPSVLDQNVSLYRTTTPLFVVTQFIDGPTLAEHVGTKRRLGFDEAFEITSVLATTLSRFHVAGGLHRDLKPDNVILSGDRDPILVDFGMASVSDEDHETADEDFRTRLDQELGNRFLRLPEFAPGIHAEDERTDTTLLAGLLFFMIVGRAPRVLRDGYNRAPHDAIPAALADLLSQDPRWPRLRRVFTKAFQPQMDQRYQSADALREDIAQLSEVLFTPDELAEISRLRQLLGSSTATGISGVRALVENVAFAFLRSLEERIEVAGLSLADQSVDVSPNGNVVEVTGRLRAKELDWPESAFSHRVEVSGGQIACSFVTEGSQPNYYYRESSSDSDAATQRARDAAGRVFLSLLQSYNVRLDGLVRRREEGREPRLADEYPLGVELHVHGSFTTGAPPTVTSANYSVAASLRNNAASTIPVVGIQVLVPLQLKPAPGASSTGTFIGEEDGRAKFAVETSIALAAGESREMLIFLFTLTRDNVKPALESHVFITVRGGDSRYTISRTVSDLCESSPQALEQLQERVR